MSNNFNAQLYAKAAEEQQQYHDWLLSLTPEQILQHTYEYTTRQDILISLSEHNLSEKQAEALLKSPCPLSDLFNHYAKQDFGYDDDIRSSNESRANAVLREELVAQHVSSNTSSVVLIDRDYNGVCERFALTPDEFSEMYGITEQLPSGGKSYTLRANIRLRCFPAKVNDDRWNKFFTDMSSSLGTPAYIRFDLMKRLRDAVEADERFPSHNKDEDMLPPAVYPAKSLPNGWMWVDYLDGSGHLESPSGESSFSFDMNTSAASMGGIEYEYPARSWNNFYGSLSEFKEHAESITLVEINREPPIANGLCGAHLRWSLGENGTLTIHGLGKMDTYLSIKQVPWNGYRDSIKKLALGAGVHSISGCAFSGCEKLTEVDIPKGVHSIGQSAFYGCTALERVVVPEGVEEVGYAAFKRLAPGATIIAADPALFEQDFNYDNAKVEVPAGESQRPKRRHNHER